MFVQIGESAFQLGFVQRWKSFQVEVFSGFTVFKLRSGKISSAPLSLRNGESRRFSMYRPSPEEAVKHPDFLRHIAGELL